MSDIENDEIVIYINTNIIESKKMLHNALSHKPAEEDTKSLASV